MTNKKPNEKPKNKPRQSFAWPDLIREYRMSMDLTVLQYARMLEISPQAVYMWESGKREAPYRVTQAVLCWIVAGMGEGADA